ncbi:MAG: tetratricopeptide repeat protein, partial [Candidatus Thorarchaeota archaeon]
MSKLVSKELVRVKKCIDEVNFEDALRYIKDIEKNENVTNEEALRILSYKGAVSLNLGQFENALNLAEELYERSQEMKMPLFSLDALYLKSGCFLWQQRFKEMYNNLKRHEELFNAIPKEHSLEYQEREGYFLYMKGGGFSLKGNLDLALDYFKSSLAIFKHINPQFYPIPTILWSIAYAYQEKGELNLALEYIEKVLSLLPKREYFYVKTMKASIYRVRGFIYYKKGNFDTALEYLTLCLDFYEKIDHFMWMSRPYYWIIDVLLKKEDFNQAQNYLQQFKQFNEKHETKDGYLLYQLSHILILKSSSRLRERVEAENLLKKFVDEKPPLDITNIALIHLCELYFEEFRLSSHMEILDDIYLLIDHLQSNAKYQNSYSLLANVKLLQAKLALLQINMLEARKLLSESQQIAEEHDLQLLAREISREHDHLLEELKLWESIKKEQASVAERLKLASLDSTMERLQGKRAIEP